MNRRGGGQPWDVKDTIRSRAVDPLNPSRGRIQSKECFGGAGSAGFRHLGIFRLRRLMPLLAGCFRVKMCSHKLRTTLEGERRSTRSVCSGFLFLFSFRNVLVEIVQELLQGRGHRRRRRKRRWGGFRCGQAERVRAPALRQRREGGSRLRVATASETRAFGSRKHAV